ncbi:hypothetical protein ACFOG5_13345 [Pedobacter fastidiosus]|uniref:Uncharacterized protein n=1 Tax=Pedobacter fastidiosus TaxID=2765361 RepID=A0ABR7KLN4_9SPHI|nr:hypothetical protein [Pedobacter fastidiosus]MBC6108985.1 hypothetical protein [Pedobacter fastidiosus]
MLLKINPSKFRELLNVLDINTQLNRITLFTQIRSVHKGLGAIYMEKSDFEVSFDAYLQKLEKTESKFSA